VVGGTPQHRARDARAPGNARVTNGNAVSRPCFRLSCGFDGPVYPDQKAFKNGHQTNVRDRCRAAVIDMIAASFANGGPPFTNFIIPISLELGLGLTDQFLLRPGLPAYDFTIYQ